MYSSSHAALFLKAGYNRLRRRVFGEKRLSAAADKIWEVAPAEIQTTKPAVFLPGEFDKVRTLERRTTHDIESKRVHGGDFERPPVMAYQCSDALLHKGAVWSKGRHWQVLPFNMSPPPSRDFPVETVNEGALAGSYLGLLYFGHWLHDDLPLSLLACEYGDPVSPAPPNLHKALHKESHVDGYVKFLDAPWRAAENVFFKSLVLFNDEEFTSHKAARITMLRNRAAAQLGAVSEKKRVFIKRGVVDKGVRRFHNEKAVAQALADEGFTILTPADLTFKELAQEMHGAELVVAAEGSHIVHALYFLQPGGGLMAITAPEHFNTVNKRWADHFNIQYGFVVGDAEEEGFSANIDDVKRTVDLFRL